MLRLVETSTLNCVQTWLMSNSQQTHGQGATSGRQTMLMKSPSKSWQTDSNMIVLYYARWSGSPQHWERSTTTIVFLDGRRDALEILLEAKCDTACISE
jgi:hypothetical protein